MHIEIAIHTVHKEYGVGMKLSLFFGGGGGINFDHNVEM